MPANILNLPAFTVQRVEESDHDYHVYAEVSNPPSTCATCNSDRLIGHGRNEQVIRDLPTHGKRLAIYVDTRRWRCQSCGKTFMETLPAVNAKREMTDRLVRWIGQQSLKRTFASLADETGLDEKTIRNIFRDYINELEQQFRFETPKWMGIDEIHIINKPRCVVSNIQNNTIVDMLQNRNKDTVSKYLTRMPNRDKVQYVAMDMWTPYRDAVQAVLPDATIVIDKFHVVRMANDAMERARKGMRAELTLKQKRGLMHDRFVMLKRKRDLCDEERLNLDGWTKNYPMLGEAYRLKEDFFEVYEATSPEDAARRFEAWRDGIPAEIRPYYADLIRAFQNWHPFILNYFGHPVTNAYTESLNSLIRVMNRLGRGYSFEALRAKILFTEGAHKHTLSRPKFKRRRAPERKVAEPATVGYALADGIMPFGKAIPLSRKGRSESEHPHESPGPPKNYGADIATLIELLESGRL
ncbi:ISL3 family transposase [Hydrocarboniphaga effusa]|uniref:ISL3 family transposase n=1 Tax=Hydrocarboniphaga effusa TaxID=243629 RepID=UPI00398C21DA